MIIRSIILIACLMMGVNLHADMKFQPLISKEDIAVRVGEMGQTLHNDYEGKNLVIVSVLKGAICITADLMRAIDLPLELQTIRCSSYGLRGATRGELTVTGLENVSLEGKDVLIVDDIFDSGATISALRDLFQKQNPSSIKTCVLLYKDAGEKLTDYRPEYVLFNIPDAFVVGYGLDFKEQHRGLPDVCEVIR
jgi:hypoxanthine phosphoribosyltransferase